MEHIKTDLQAYLYVVSTILPWIIAYFGLGYLSIRLITLKGVDHPLSKVPQISLAVLALYFSLCILFGNSVIFTIFLLLLSFLIFIPAYFIRKKRSKKQGNIWEPLAPFRREQSKNILLSVVTVVPILLLFEGYVRMHYQYQNYTEKNGGGYQSSYKPNCIPGWYAICPPEWGHEGGNDEYSFPQNYNNEGMNDSHWSLSDTATKKIACIGDSFTEGLGSTTHDSTYPTQLGKLLGIKVMNAGLSGNDPVNNFLIFRDIVTKYHPMTLTLTVNSTDITDVILRGGFERFHPDGSMHYRKAPWWEPIYATSFIARHVILGTRKLNDMLLPLDSMPAEREHAFKVLEQSLDSFSVECAKRNIRLLIVFHPSEYEIENGLDCQRILDYANAKGYQTVDVRKYFMEHGVTKANAHAYFWPHDCHNNSDGYKLFAAALAEKLKSMHIEDK